MRVYTCVLTCEKNTHTDIQHTHMHVYETTTRKVRTFNLDGFGNLGFELLILMWFQDIERYFQTIRMHALSQENYWLCYESPAYAIIWVTNDMK